MKKKRLKRYPTLLGHFIIKASKKCLSNTSLQNHKILAFFKCPQLDKMTSAQSQFVVDGGILSYNHELPAS